jgi:hypothetical protein
MNDASTSTEVPTIRVRVDAEDLLAFYRFHSTHSRTVLISLLLPQVVSVALGFQVAFNLFEESSPVPRAIAATVISLLCGLFMSTMLRFVLGRMQRRLIRENPGMLGEFEYRLEDEFIAEIAESHETRRRYGEIRRIYDVPKAVYIYSSAGSTFALPKAKILAGDIDLFVGKLRQRIANG